METLDIKATRVFKETFAAKTPFIVNEGGTRSSKTYSIAQVFIVLMLQNRGKDTFFACVRKTMPALRASAMRDFFEILNDLGIYRAADHNMSDNTYRIGKSLIEFFSVDDEQKVRGRKRKYLWINEANELTYDDFFQLNIRTEGQVYFDYNPSDMVHWLYNEITHDALGRPRENCTLIKSTYRDNPFLPAELVKKIEAIRDQDVELWTVYGLGERAKSRKTIYDNWALVKSMPDGQHFYGLDFGYNEPSALLQLCIKDGELWARELIYETKLTNSQLIERLKLIVPDWRTAFIYADSAEPARIEEIRLSGFDNIQGADKGKGSVRRGIDMVKRHKVFITEDSVNLIKELQTYKWRTDKAGELMDEPVEFNDHLVSAQRYAVMSHLDVPHFEILFGA